MNKTINKKKEPKITNEKPVSLNPLNFKEALTALFAVKPPEKSKKKKTNKPSK